MTESTDKAEAEGVEAEFGVADCSDAKRVGAVVLAICLWAWMRSSRLDVVLNRPTKGRDGTARERERVRRQFLAVCLEISFQRGHL